MVEEQALPLPLESLPPLQPPSELHSFAVCPVSSAGSLPPAPLLGLGAAAPRRRVAFRHPIDERVQKRRSVGTAVRDAGGHEQPSKLLYLLQRVSLFIEGLWEEWYFLN